MAFFGGFPFGNFGGANDDDQRGQQEQENEDSKLYQILEIDQNASAEQIKESYQRLKKLYESDSPSSDPKKLQQINDAYEMLSDPFKRQMYDQMTKQGGQNQNEFMNMFFGGHQPKGQKQLPKVQPTKKAFQITLEQIYNGDKIQVSHQRIRICQSCKGKGGQNVEKCQKCKGRGQIVQLYQMGPGMYQQLQKVCQSCKGQGQNIGEGGKCQCCQGKKIKENQKTVTLIIQKGTPNNYPIVLEGQGNQIPQTQAGDLVFIVQQKIHQTFVRKGADLFIKKKINLLQSLTGFSFTFKHLNGKQYSLSTKKGSIIADHGKKIVKNLGMPFFKDQQNYGNLIIEFIVQMPKRGQLKKQQLTQLSTILPGTINPRPPNENYCMLQDFDIENVNSNEEGGGKSNKDEEQQYKNEGIGCAAQ